MSLNNQSVCLGDLGRWGEALAASQEATDIYQELAVARPDAFRPELARSLTNLSIRLSSIGRREDALAAIEGAVTIRRELAARWPDAYRRELEASLQVAARLERGEDFNDDPRDLTRDNGPLSLPSVIVFHACRLAVAGEQWGQFGGI